MRTEEAAAPEKASPVTHHASGTKKYKKARHLKSAEESQGSQSEAGEGISPRHKESDDEFERSGEVPLGASSLEENTNIPGMSMRDNDRGASTAAHAKLGSSGDGDIGTSPPRVKPAVAEWAPLEHESGEDGYGESTAISALSDEENDASAPGDGSKKNECGGPTAAQTVGKESELVSIGSSSPQAEPPAVESTSSVHAVEELVGLPDMTPVGFFECEGNADIPENEGKDGLSDALGAAHDD